MQDPTDDAGIGWLHSLCAVGALALQLAALAKPPKDRLGRVLVVIIIWLMTVDAVYFLRVSPPKLAYLSGLWLGWFSIQSFLLILAYPSPNEGGDQSKDVGSKARSPNISALETMFSFRTLGWKQYKKRSEADSHSRSTDGFCQSCGFHTPSLLSAIVRLILNLICIYICQISVFPTLKDYLPSMGRPITDGPWSQEVILRSTQAVISLLATWCLVDLVYSSWSCFHAILKLTNSHHHSYWANPSPWGSVRYLARYGLTGPLSTLTIIWWSC